MAGSTLRRHALTVVQYGTALVAFAWLLTQFDLHSALSLLANVSPGVALALVAVSLAGLLARFYTWYVMISPLQRVRFQTAAGTDLVVNFVNQLLPSRLSGRIAAPFVLRSQTGMAYADAAAVAGAHTGLYAILYGLTSLLGIAVGSGRLPVELVVILLFATVLYVAAGGIVLFSGVNLSSLERFVGVLTDFARRVPRIGPSLAERVDGLLEFTSASTDGFRTLVFDPRVWIRYAVGWTGSLVVAPGVRVWLLLGSFGVYFEPAVLLPLYLLTAYSVTLLPLTPGGIGVTEATATTVFVALGVPVDVIVPIVFVDRFIGVYLPALAGWYPSVRMDLTALSTE